MSAYANYGTVLFALLMPAGWWIACSRADMSRMVAALWTPLGVLAALGINQPLADGVSEVLAAAVQTPLRPLLTAQPAPDATGTTATTRAR